MISAEVRLDGLAKRRRHRLAGRSGDAETPEVLAVTTAEFLNDVRIVERSLHTTGVALVHLDRLLRRDEFIALGCTLGLPIAEHATAVRPYVEEGIVLRIMHDHETTNDVDLQPFAANYLTLHTECSRSAIERQPSFLQLMCVEPSLDSSDGMTLLVPMARVAALLRAESVPLLQKISYAEEEADAPFLRFVNGRPVFSFRDFGDASFRCRYTGSIQTTPEEIMDAVGDLANALYEAAPLAVRWQRGMLAIFSNTHFFHGRTALSSTAEKRRELWRLRLGCHPAQNGRKG